MKRWRRNLVIAAGAVALILAAGIVVAAGPRSFVGPRARSLRAQGFARTPQRLARGQYLAEAVSGCMDCHSPRDWTRHDNPILPGTKGSGQDMSFLQGLPGRV